ncbi:MAG: Holliday junction resolvase-like protein [Candidatus Aenigmatarchaeota archaeon]
MIEYILVLIAGLIIGAFAAYQFCKRIMLRAFWKKDIVDEHAARSQIVVKGKVAEQIASIYPDFKHVPSDARFLGSPIDYVIFDGMSEGKPIDIVLMDVKQGGSRLTANQEKIKDAVEKKRMKWETLRLD